MKQSKFIFILAALAALSVVFSSCNRDDIRLEGTTWVFEERIEGGMTGRNTITFTSESAGTMATAIVAGAVEIPLFTYPLTYTFDAPIIRMILAIGGGETSTLVGEVRGSRMTLVGNEERVFIRQ